MDLAQFWFQGADGPTPPFQLGNSLRFRGAQHLSRTNSAAPTGSMGTLSVWAKRRGTDYNADTIIEGGANRAKHYLRGVSTGTDGRLDMHQWFPDSGGVDGGQVPNAQLRDPSAWYHIVWQHQNTGDRNLGDRMWINGVLQTALEFPGNYNGQDWGVTVNGGTVQIGRYGTGNGYLVGYLSEFHVVDGALVDPGTFGEFNADGVWVPRDVNLTQAEYGQNGFFLDFSDPDDIGADRSGNGNNFTATGFELTDTTSTLYDWMADSPTDNFATLNAVDAWFPGNNVTGPRRANLGLDAKDEDRNNHVTATVKAPHTGRWYFEQHFTQLYTANGFDIVAGLIERDKIQWEGLYSRYGEGPFAYTYFAKRLPYNVSSNNIMSRGTAQSCSVFPQGWDDVLTWPNYVNTTLQIAYDADTGDLWFGWDGVWADGSGGTTGDPANGLNPCTTLDDPTLDWAFYHSSHGSIPTTETSDLNFGQLPFHQTPPAGFEPLSTAGLPDVAITNPSEHFQTVLAPGSQILTYRSSITAEPSALTHAVSFGGVISDTSSVSRLFGQIIPCGDQTQYVRFETPTFDANSSGGNSPDTNWIEFDPPLAMSGDCALLFGETGTGNNAGNVGGSARVTYGDGTIDTAIFPNNQQLPPLFNTVYGGLTLNNFEAMELTMDGSKTLRRLSFGNNMTSRFNTKLITLRINGSYVNYFNSVTIQVADASGFQVGDIVSRSDSQRIYGVVDAINGNTLTIDTMDDWQPGWSGQAVVKYACNTTDFGPFGSGLIWIKDRDNSNQHQLVDSVRGGNLAFQSPAAGNEAAYVAPAGNSVAWCWATPGNPAANTEGTIESQVDANQQAGFSIATYTGSGASTASVGHGLSQSPEFVIVKKRQPLDSHSFGGTFVVAHTGIDVANTSLGLNLNVNAQAFGSGWVNALGAQTFSVVNGFASSENLSNVNRNGSDYVAYCWHSVPGYSAFGSYVGTGTTDAAFCFTGFRPAFLMTKSTSTGDWQIRDNLRGGSYNPVYATLAPNHTRNENAASSIYDVDFLSNGFKIRGDMAALNGSGQTIIWAAWAEHPFGGGNVSPSPAR